MKDKALEVSLNGRRLCIVGMEDWAMINACVNGRRYHHEVLEKIKKHCTVEEFDSLSRETIALRCSVGVPDSDNPSSSTGQQYERHELNIGDVVTIRLVETDDPDKPIPTNPDQAQVLFRSVRDP